MLHTAKHMGPVEFYEYKGFYKFEKHVLRENDMRK
jgi:hypothetical protein